MLAEDKPTTELIIALICWDNQDLYDLYMYHQLKHFSFFLEKHTISIILLSVVRMYVLATSAVLK